MQLKEIGENFLGLFGYLPDKMQLGTLRKAAGQFIKYIVRSRFLLLNKAVAKILLAFLGKSAILQEPIK